MEMCWYIFTVLLSVLFIGLKITHNIMWSWLWVLSPLWISAILFIIYMIICAIVVIKAFKG